MKTLKEAREKGFMKVTEVRDNCWPVAGARTIVLKGHILIHRRDLEQYRSATAWREWGRKVVNQEDRKRSHGSYRGSHYWVYPESATEPVNGKRIIPPKKIDLAEAVFCVNRAAKRFRDSATAHYRSGTHGFARACKEKKELLYRLKDKGLKILHDQKRISLVGRHGSNLLIYKGEKYCFHSYLFPANVDVETLNNIGEDDDILHVDAKRKTEKTRLKDAIYTLEIAEESQSQFDSVPRPVFLKRCYKTYDENDFDDEI